MVSELVDRYMKLEGDLGLDSPLILFTMTLKMVHVPDYLAGQARNGWR